MLLTVQGGWLSSTMAARITMPPMLWPTTMISDASRGFVSSCITHEKAYCMLPSCLIGSRLWIALSASFRYTAWAKTYPPCTAERDPLKSSPKNRNLPLLCIVDASDRIWAALHQQRMARLQPSAGTDREGLPAAVPRHEEHRPLSPARPLRLLPLLKQREAAHGRGHGDRPQPGARVGHFARVVVGHEARHAVMAEEQGEQAPHTQRSQKCSHILL